jgi:CheY-like chemotaxis protein
MSFTKFLHRRLGRHANRRPRRAVSWRRSRSLDKLEDGLGLALIKGLVELHDGCRRAKSEGVGPAAESTFYLSQGYDLPAPSKRPTLQAPTSRCLRILVVEDNHDTANTLRVLLECYGYEVTVAYSGTEGVEAAKKVRPDVVLCDIGLPGMDGYAVARALRKSPETADARLIAVTGYGREEDKKLAFESGFDKHMLKPVHPEKLLEQLPPASG